MKLKFLPDDINIEDVLSYLPDESYTITIGGIHNRNAYGDILQYNENTCGKIDFHIGRRGLYELLPECIFHPINRFDNIPEYDRKERYEEEIRKQEIEVKNAYEFFAPIDVLLLDLKSKIKDKIVQYTTDDVVMQNVIGDDLTKTERNNRFIKHAIQFLPICKRIRGNRTLLSLMLRKILYDEGVMLHIENIQSSITDKKPKYNYVITGNELDSMYVGNEFSDNINTYTIQYWSDDDCSDKFNCFLDELEVFRVFLQDYFISIEDELYFNVVKDTPILNLSSDNVYNFLNYNANIAYD